MNLDAFQVRNDILSLNQAKIGEIRSYSSPPHGVHEVMKAVYFILDYSADEVEVIMLTNSTNQSNERITPCFETSRSFDAHFNTHSH